MRLSSHDLQSNDRLKSMIVGKSRKKKVEIVKANVQAQKVIRKMNNLETRYSQYLDALMKVGELSFYRYEEHKFYLAPKTYLTPDFYILFPDGHIEIHETKGFWREDARVKIKVAAAKYNEYIWKAVQWKGGQWVYELF